MTPPRVPVADLTPAEWAAAALEQADTAGVRVALVQTEHLRALLAERETLTSAEEVWWIDDSDADPSEGRILGLYRTPGDAQVDAEDEFRDRELFPDAEVTFEWRPAKKHFELFVDGERTSWSVRPDEILPRVVVPPSVELTTETQTEGGE